MPAFANPPLYATSKPMLDYAQPVSPLKRHLYGAAGLSLLIVLYLLPGAVGHDPWRGDDIRHFSAVFAVLNGEGWLLPHVAGEPLRQVGPLYHWVATLFALALGGLMPVHDASRLASPFFAGLAIFWIARASARLHGKHTRTPAALLTLGTLGLVVHAHEHQPMIALMAMQAWTLAGLALVPTQPVKGSLQAAIGMTLAFLAGGLAGLFLTVPLVLLIATTCPECRSPRASGALTLGLTLALAASAIWPILLNVQAPDLFSRWWGDSLAAITDSVGETPLPKFIELFAWFTWPLWPIAMWSVWRARRRLMQLGTILPLLSVLLAGAWIYLNADSDAATMLPFIAPLALLAAGGVPSLRRGAANAFDWFALMTFGVFATLVWLAWTAQTLAWPPGLARSLERLAPNLMLEVTTWQAALGVAIVLIWGALIWHLPRSANRGPANWAMGMTMLWCLAVTLLMPWFDHSRNYRPVAESAAIALAGESPGCVASIGLSDSHRAALDYFAGVRVEEVAVNETTCRFLLAHDDRLPLGLQPAQQWQQIWEYRHAGGRRLEVFRLYRRD